MFNYIIENRAIGIFDKYCAVLTNSLTDILNIAGLLHEKKVISDVVLSNVTTTKESSEQLMILLTAVREAVQINFCHLKTFAVALMTYSSVHVGVLIYSEYNEGKSNKTKFIIMYNYYY